MPARPRPPNGSCSITGENHRVGEVHDGNTTMDFDPQERARGIAINVKNANRSQKGPGGI
jgi:translation elongation factor EF-G